MKSHPATVENKAQMLQYFEETYDYRQTKIASLNSPTLVMQMFPKYEDYDGRLVKKKLMSFNLYDGFNYFNF